MEQTHPRVLRYAVNKTTYNGSDHFDLTIGNEVNGTTSEDGGRYGCKRPLDDTTFYTAYVNILGKYVEITY